MMCVVHDIAEARVGDIAPSHGIPKEEKIRLETVRDVNLRLDHMKAHSILRKL